MHLDVRRQGAVRSTAVMFAIGIGEDGQREILGVETALSETEQGWYRFIQKLKERGLSGVEVATSDAHSGLKQALRESFPGLIWQRCQAHFKRNVLDQTPVSYKDRMDQVLDQLLRAASQQEAQDRLSDLREELMEDAPSALEVLEDGVLEDGFFEATAVLVLPGKYRRRLRTTNMVERFIQEIRRREKVVRIFPNQESVYRLVGALCAETHEEWSTGRCYFDMEEFFRGVFQVEGLLLRGRLSRRPGLIDGELSRPR